jgi:hypothetical protein
VTPRSPNPFTSLPSGLPSSFDLGSDLEAVLAGPGIVNDPFHYLAAVTPLPAVQLDGSDATRPTSGRRLDYIMVSQTILDLGPAAEVYDSADEGLPGGLWKEGSTPPKNASQLASDHLLVFADVTVPGSSSCSTNSDCDDGLACNGTETCANGSCAPGAPVDCSSLTDPCNTGVCVEPGSCERQAVRDGTSCGDGLVCNGEETCSSGSCIPGTGPSCDDGNACTTDTCSEPDGCSNSWVACSTFADGCCPPGCEASDPDCGAACGDGVCEGNGEDCRTCPQDCPCKGKDCAKACCGDGVCEGENARQCPVDCGG